MYLDQCGLFLDIVGVLLIAFLGFPTSFIEQRRINWDWEGPESVIQKITSWIGTFLIITGFVMQFFSYLCPTLKWPG